MSYSVDNIVKLQIRLSQQGVGLANFGKAVLLSAKADATADDKDQFFKFSSLTELATKFATTTETYKAAATFLGGIPTSKEIYIWHTDPNDENIAATLTKARSAGWWFFTFVTKDVYDSADDVKSIAAWAESERSYFANCQSDATEVANIRNPAKTDDLASQLNTFGYRFTRTFANLESPYAGIAEAKWFAAVNYQVALATITGEYKALSGIAAEELGSNAMGAMEAKNVGFYTGLDLQGSTTSGKDLNTKTHSGDWVDDVINLEAFSNALKVGLCNAIITQPAKLPRTPAGQQILLDAVTTVGDQYIANGYLAELDYVVPETGKMTRTRGYEILTHANDILSISGDMRTNRQGAPINMRIFPGGAIHEVSMITDVF